MRLGKVFTKDMADLFGAVIVKDGQVVACLVHIPLAVYLLATTEQ